MKDEKFSWVETHQKITQYLSTKENSQQDLIDMLKSVGIGPFNDKAGSGEHDIELDEIDPFTFYCYIYKYGTKRRLKYLQDIATNLNIEKPSGESGIPSAQAQKVWLFPYKYERNNNEVSRLWNLFNKELKGEITDQDFSDALLIRSTGKTKLTEALFYINPEKYLPINGPTKPYIKEVFGIDPKFNTYTEYLKILSEIREKISIPFYELSYEAWKWNDERKKVNYWVFQGNPRVFDFETALSQEILTDWTVSAHKEKIKIGDKVILWITGDQAGCYALGEVTSKPHQKTTSPDDHLWKVEDKSWLKADIKITYNLVNNPILSEDIKGVDELNDLKVGNQGTNFNATQDEYETLLEMATAESKFQTTKNKFDPKIFDQYIKLLRKLNNDLNLAPNDPRIVYSVRGYRLNLIIGQRYCLNIFTSDGRGNFGIISEEKLKDTSEPFDGKPPQPYYNYYDLFEPNNKEWASVLSAIKNELSRTKKSGFKKYNDSDFENFVFEIGYTQNTNEKNMDFPLNTILYGPPGTGKTYNTILRAAQIIENRIIDSYEEALDIFRSNLHNQIEFITFHQNYSYEDFIQGLRPETDNKSSLVFDKKDGVFKKIADRALSDINNKNLNKRPFEDVFSELVIKPFKNELSLNWHRNKFTIISITEKEITFKETKGPVLIEVLKEMYETEEDVEDDNWVLNKAHHYCRGLIPLLLDYGRKYKNYVIIIDEINRANISRVFGELITLIEPDKRSHGAIPLEARLPSGDPFIVPSNLFIIGTMNTADKSIALLDIALRRRFEFESMYPKYEIMGQEIYDVEILKKINEQIIKSKGHDFQIGHAYFMGENKDLVHRMNKKVIPLLLEYYMNDEKEVKGILNSAGLIIEENSWPLKISGKND
ncbi:EVE domain-containing protein [Chitinophagales bacterium]|nr:EVE domain-containing protein [Chitinophagales bacterium]